MLLRLTFLKVCRLDEFFIRHYDKNRFLLHEKTNQSRQKVKGELVFRQNNCVIMCARLARAAAPLCCMRATFRFCVRVSSLLCACFIAVVCVTLHSCAHDFSLLCARLCTLMRVTLRSCASDFSSLCA